MSEVIEDCRKRAGAILRQRNCSADGSPTEDQGQRCRTCKIVKPLEAFGRHLGGRRGRRVHCKICLRDGRRKPQAMSPEHRQRQRERLLDPQYRASQQQASKRSRKRYPQAIAAAQAVAKAVRSGRLQKATTCQALGCSSTRSIQGHHRSYDHRHRFEVAWLCASCHKRAHSHGFVALKHHVPWHWGRAPSPEPMDEAADEAAP